MFEQLSTRYPNAIFLKVDVDKCQETAAGQGVNAMPTFIFYRNRIKLGLSQGANPERLEAKIIEYYEAGDGDDSEGPVSGHVRKSKDTPFYHIFGMIFLAVVLYYWSKN